MTRRDWALLCVIVVFAAAARLVFLDSPPGLVLDEFWYARDGCFYWRASAAECGLTNLVAPDRDVSMTLAVYGELTPEHPPLGKWLIGAPMEVLDFGVRAWRLASVGAGVLSVALLFVLVKRAVASTAAAAGASAFSRSTIRTSSTPPRDARHLRGAVRRRRVLLLRSRPRADRRPGRGRALAPTLAACGGGGGGCGRRVQDLRRRRRPGRAPVVTVWEIAARRRSAQRTRGVGRELFSIVLLLVAVPLRCMSRPTRAASTGRC